MSDRCHGHKARRCEICPPNLDAATPEQLRSMLAAAEAKREAARESAMDLSYQLHAAETRAAEAETKAERMAARIAAVTTADDQAVLAVERARRLVANWQANGNSRPLDDPTARTWHQCAQQLHSALGYLVHQAPNDDSGAMPCCGRTPFEVPATDQMTLEPEAVTCCRNGATADDTSKEN